MTKEEIKERRRLEEDYYLKKKVELSVNDREAQRRYNQYVSKDPFPMIETALLNSADIFQYVAKTGMIYPFDVQKLQGASYEVALRGTVIWWDEENKKEHVERLEKPGDSFQLEPNSIAFVTLEPMFRIPDYLALRFNLKIVHVYKGLLLGTGPLVDPGFVGRLSIPLHNLTANTYTFYAGDGMIQMEFTKLSKNGAWTVDKNNVSGLYKRKWIAPGRTLKDYIARALIGSNNTVVKSSIPDELSKIKNESIALKSEVETFKEGTEGRINIFETDVDKRLNRAQWVNVATIVSIAAVVVSIMTYACNTIYQLGSANSVKQEKIYELEKEYEQLSQEYNDTKNELNDRILELEKQLELIKDSENGGTTSESTD